MKKGEIQVLFLLKISKEVIVGQKTVDVDRIGLLFMLNTSSKPLSETFRCHLLSWRDEYCNSIKH